MLDNDLRFVIHNRDLDRNNLPRLLDPQDLLIEPRIFHGHEAKQSTRSGENPEFLLTGLDAIVIGQ